MTAKTDSDSRKSVFERVAQLQRDGKPIPLDLQRRALEFHLEDEPGREDLKAQLARVCRRLDEPLPESAFGPIDTRIDAAVRQIYSARRTALTEAVFYVCCSDVPGDIAEFGTMSGETASAIAVAMRAVVDEFGLGQDRVLSLLDSFEGLPEPTSEPDLASPHVQDGRWARGGCFVLSQAELANRISAILGDRYEILAGWYAQTVPALASARRFAMVHVDCDLYASAMDALAPLFARGQLSNGAVLCFDDWMSNRSDPTFGERRAFDELTQRYQIVSEPWGFYGWSGHRVLVRDYRPDESKIDES
jgi:hypothetical protein